MKLRIVVIDLEIPPRVKRWALRLGIPLVVLVGGTAVAWAAGLTVWTQGDVLNADDLNANFTYVQGEIAALQAAPTYFAVTDITTPGSGCALVTGTTTSSPIVDCTCPAGMIMLSGGGYATDSANRFIGETRPTSSTTWRTTCYEYTAGTGTTARVMCGGYSYVCGP